MIISEKHQFSFIHIPKCAGTSVRQILQPFDSYQGRFTGRVDHHLTFGQLDYVHIPLFVLQDHFPSEFEAVMNYWSFAVVRDPFARFASSVSQRLRKYSDRPVQNRPTEDIRSFVHETINYLLQHEQERHLLPPEFIHFQRQIDYIKLDDEQIVGSLYTVNQIGELLADVSQKTGQNLLANASDSSKMSANRTIVYRNDLLRRVIDTSRPVINKFNKFLPEPVKQTLRDRVYVPRDQRIKHLFETEHVQAFIRNYYADDIKLYERVSETERTRKA